MNNNKGPLYAVYGTLRKGQSNHRILDDKNVEFIGHYVTESIYTMFDVSGSYPALVGEGDNSVVLEIYRVNDEKIEDRLDHLEGYSNSDYDLYNKDIIETPFGHCFIYFYNHDTSNLKQIYSGDWTDHKNIEYVQ